MALLLQPGRRFINRDEAVTYTALNQMATPIAILEPESIGTTEFNTAQINGALAAFSLGVTRTLTLGVSTTINPNTTELLPAFPPAPLGSVVDDLIYFQQAVGLHLKGYIEMRNYLNGGMYAAVRVRVTNLTTTSRIMSAGLDLFYIVQSSVVNPQPATTGHVFDVTPGAVWAAHDPVTITKLNDSGFPTVTPPILYAVDINGAELQALAAKNVGKRATFTVGSAISVPVGNGILIGSVSIAAPVGEVVFVSQPLAVPIFVAFKLSGSNIVQIYANNQTFGTVSVPAGTQIKLIVV